MTNNFLTLSSENVGHVTNKCYSIFHADKGLATAVKEKRCKSLSMTNRKVNIYPLGKQNLHMGKEGILGFYFDHGHLTFLL